MNWYCSEILFLVLHLSRFHQGQIILETDKKMYCTILVRAGLQLGAQTFYKFTSTFLLGMRQQKLVALIEAMKKEKPHGGTASRLYFETTWLFIFSRQIRAYLIPSV